jgi:hypothetical protein
MKYKWRNHLAVHSDISPLVSSSAATRKGSEIGISSVSKSLDSWKPMLNKSPYIETVGNIRLFGETAMCW